VSPALLEATTMPNSFPEKTGKKRKAQSAIFLNVRNPLPLFLVYANREGSKDEQEECGAVYWSFGRIEDR
jgi:hypothetical protein